LAHALVDRGQLKAGETLLVLGAAGGVGTAAIQIGKVLGARVIAASSSDEKGELCRSIGADATINYATANVRDELKQLTGGKGPEKCIDAVGMEAHALRSLDSMIDRVKQSVMIESDRPHVLREMMYVCRPAGVLSIAGVYGGMVDKIPFGAAMNKGLTIRTGQTHVKRWTDELLQRISDGQIDPSFVITHSVPLEDGPAMYKTFRDKEDGCIKVVMKP